MCQAEAAERPRDRYAVDRHLVRLGDFQHQIVQRQIGFGLHPRLQPGSQTGQLAMPAAIALGARLQPARLAFQNDHVVHELHRNPKPRRRRPMRMALFDECDNTLAKFYRKWLAHPGPPYLPYRQGITDQRSWES